MNNGLSGIKNIIWAFAIVVALAAVLVGLITTMVLGFGGQRQDGTMYLGESAGTSAGDRQRPDNGVDGGLENGFGAMALPGSQDTGLEYLFNLTFLCDSSFSAVNSFGANFGSTASAQVWLPAGGSFPAANAAGTKIIYPNDGTEKSPADAAGLYQPARLVIYLGAMGWAAPIRPALPPDTGRWCRAFSPQARRRRSSAAPLAPLPLPMPGWTA